MQLSFMHLWPLHVVSAVLYDVAEGVATSTMQQTQHRCRSTASHFLVKSLVAFSEHGMETGVHVCRGMAMSCLATPSRHAQLPQPD